MKGKWLRHKWIERHGALGFEQCQHFISSFFLSPNSMLRKLWDSHLFMLLLCDFLDAFFRLLFYAIYYSRIFFSFTLQWVRFFSIFPFSIFFSCYAHSLWSYLCLLLALRFNGMNWSEISHQNKRLAMFSTFSHSANWKSSSDRILCSEDTKGQNIIVCPMITCSLHIITVCGHIVFRSTIDAAVFFVAKEPYRA